MYWYSIYYLAVLFLEAFKRNYKSQIKIIYICPELIDFGSWLRLCPAGLVSGGAFLVGFSF